MDQLFWTESINTTTDTIFYRKERIKVIENQNHKDEFAKYSKKDLLEMSEYIDAEKYPERYNHIINELKSRETFHTIASDSKNSEIPKSKSTKHESVDQAELTFIWTRKKDNEISNQAQILPKIIKSAIIATLLIPIALISHIAGLRGRYDPPGTQMSYQDAVIYIKSPATLSSCVTMWAVVFLGSLAVLIYLKSKSYHSICNSCHSQSDPQKIGTKCNCGGDFEDMKFWKMECKTDATL